MSTVRSYFSAAEKVAASELIASHFRRFGLTIHTGSQRKRRRLENVGHSLSEDWTGIIGWLRGGHRNRRRPLYVLLPQVQILRILLPELNDTADITERISQARKLFGFMNKQLLSNKR
jgi:hypothetical protein